MPQNVSLDIQRRRSLVYANDPEMKQLFTNRSIDRWIDSIAEHQVLSVPLNEDSRLLDLDT